jgi:hypothetical protein
VDAAAPKEAKVRRKPPTQNLGSKTTEGEKAATRLIFARPNRVHLRPDLAAFGSGQVSHGAFQILVPEQLLHRLQVHPGLQQRRGIV